MRIYKSKWFSKWALNQGITDSILLGSAEDLKNGLTDANLGGHVYKKRFAMEGRGKSGGLRTLLAFKAQSDVFFIYGFAKNDQGNISSNELTALKLMAKELLGLSPLQLSQAIKTGSLIEVIQHG